MFDFKLTDEQTDIINTDSNMKVEARAGSAKTTTIILKIKKLEETLLQHKRSKQILYLVFNKSAKEHAKRIAERLDLKNVDIHNAHSLAFKRIVIDRKYSFVHSYSYEELESILNIPKVKNITDYVFITHVSNCFSNYCNSNITNIEDYDYEADTYSSDIESFAYISKYQEQIKHFASQLYKLMKSKEIKCNHDFYIKELQLAHLNLRYSHILFDEAQDASPVMVDTIMQQGAIKTFVGDSNQSIYGFRKAINALGSVNFDQKSLSTSFRYCKNTAQIAQEILEWKKIVDHNYTTPEIVGMGNSTSVDSECILGRSNCELFYNIISLVLDNSTYSNFYFEGGLHKQLSTSSNIHIYDILNLKEGNISRIRNPILKNMKSFSNLNDYALQISDSELNILMRLVEEYGTRLFGIIKRLQEKQIDDKFEADVIFSTVHKAKGLEYDKVTLLNDFMSKQELQEVIDDMSDTDVMDEKFKLKLIEEINILYVAATRTKNKLIQSYV